MTDTNAVLDPEGVARGDYFDPTKTDVVPDVVPDIVPPANLDTGSGDTEIDPAKSEPGADEGAGQDDEHAAAKAVPYGRFKDVVDQKNAAQNRITELEARLAAAPAAQAAAPAAPAAPDVVADLIASRAPLYKQVEEARLDGEVDLAAELQQKIDDINANILLEKSSAVSKRTLAVDKEVQRYELLVDTLEAQYPQFRPDAPEYDPTMVRNVNETADAFEASGMTSSKALQKAIALLGPKQVAAPTAAVVAPAVPATKPDVSKSIAALKGQPTDMSTAGANKDDVKINVAALSDEEYDKLPESTRAKLRGDFGA